MLAGSDLTLMRAKALARVIKAVRRLQEDIGECADTNVRTRSRSAATPYTDSSWHVSIWAVVGATLVVARGWAGTRPAPT